MLALVSNIYIRLVLGKDDSGTTRYFILFYLNLNLNFESKRPRTTSV